MTRARIALLFLLLAQGMGIGTALGAVEGERGGEVGLLAGAVFTDENLSMQSGGTSEAALGLRGGSVFARRWTWFADMLATRVSTGGSPLGDSLTYWGRTGFEFFVRPERDLRWFGSGAAGWMKADFEHSGSADFDRPFVSGGFGQRWVLGPQAQLRWEARGDVTVDDEGLANETVGQGLLVVGLVWGPRTTGARAAGPAPAPKPPVHVADSDADGVPNSADRCEATPAGAIVGTGGCPFDGDEDGVPDGIDRCPQTRRGATVSATGCPPDADGDGVGDLTDSCAATPPGVVVDDWGCPIDRDRDGVPDGLDRCSGTSLEVIVDENGCPRDTDGDRVPDGLDLCPETDPGTAVGASGCPEVGFEFDAAREVLVLWLDFAAGSSRMNPAAEEVLDGVVELLESTPGRFEIGGHADAAGDVADPLAVSRRRAQAVFDDLVERGADPARLDVRGYGATQPIAEGATEQDRRRNRRVELRRLE